MLFLMYCAIAIFTGNLRELKNGSALVNKTESLNADMPRNDVMEYLEF